MRRNVAGYSDLIAIEFLKEARILKRQLQLMKSNIDKISTEDLIKILTITNIIEKEFMELKKEGGDIVNDRGH
ncbi:hypothetical protein NSA50_16900 [Clostridium sp. DSM 100503]|uniref:hypothetical protein n=1 Tax=Clostridium sp. DSM 100503 TaxID=2963282 RepID=UPI00214A5F27|nr:hypothetical protein [Clostridium sp. DSM 100503]MCR1952706.1 hypothetical protein [Clostridium sp. DSM 100503]